MKAAAYIRVSTIEQIVDNQLLSIENYAVSKGYTVFSSKNFRGNNSSTYTRLSYILQRFEAYITDNMERSYYQG